MSTEAELLWHVERWRRDGIPPPPELDAAAFAEALALSAALSVALAQESDLALATSLRERLRERLRSAQDARGHSSSLRMRIARSPRRRPRSHHPAKPLLWLVPLGLAAAALLVLIVFGLPSVGPGIPEPDPRTVATEDAPSRAPEPQPAPPSPAPAQQVVQSPSPEPSLPSQDAAQPQHLDSGSTVLRPTSGVAQLQAGDHRIQVAAGSVVEVSVDGGELTAVVSSGEALVEVEGHGPLRIMANERLSIAADGVPVMGGGRVILDLGAQPGRIEGQRRDGHWLGVFDPQHQLMAVDIKRFDDPLPLGGDEWLHIEHRLRGHPQWMGVYMLTEGGAHPHWSKSWPLAQTPAGWQQMRVPLAELSPPNQPASDLRLGPARLLQLRFQAGLSSPEAAPTILELRSLRLMAPHG